ncbi:TRAP transporter small permease subunit [Algicella marina]|uniref:TRAP transporter small permease protein n=2 Tax=Algicella marina TaxID=2683284 RepID=A0A6P1T6I5_9RHOB|nr:TRAP transporter small permease subunit [Algicella marina]
MSAERRQKVTNPAEWLLPAAFIAVASWVIWNGPRYIISFGWASEATQNLFTPAGALDFAALALLPVIFIVGMFTVRCAPMEYGDWKGLDRVPLFIGRITMLLIALIVLVMLYEVVVRYVFERGTYWANELSLWLAGFVFLFSGLYAMQQRSHIRIFLIYDTFPRWLQRVCDSISALLIALFAFFMFYGGFKEAYDKFLRWETFGTAFDPPLPATLKPLILFVIGLVALQAAWNLLMDWNKEPETHTPADEIDQDEIAEIRAHIKE